MINLMYIVLMAMLAMNVSSDVLDGFSQVKDGLKKTNENIEQRNASIIHTMKAYAETNPEKGTAAYEKALEVRSITTRLYDEIEQYKADIVTRVDGPNADIDNMVNREDLDAASAIMLDPSSMKGTELRTNIEQFRDYITTIVNNPEKQTSIAQLLETAPVQRKGEIGEMSWEEFKFDNQPAIAAVTLLTKLQNDIKFAEGEALQSLFETVDEGDIHVNVLNAFVIPQSRYIMRGGKYSADVVLAAVDTTKLPTVYINGRMLDNDRGHYELTAGAAGNYSYEGYIEMAHDDGSVTRHDFSSSYTVMEPSATISATMMNVLYAGIDNPISISVPGVDNSGVTATMTNGTLTRSGDGWIARPAEIGKEAKISVTASFEGSSLGVGDITFRVRKLPDPTPFIQYTDAQGNSANYMGGGNGIPKAALKAAPGISAAIDDGILNIPFEVISFQMISFDQMGDAHPENSDGARFSQRQLNRINSMKRNAQFFITSIKAKGPDGTVRELSPIQVVVK